MDEYVVVITKDGFITEKKILDVLETDETIDFRGTSLECNNYIHGKITIRYEKSFNDDSNSAIND
jgi:hypothetical protein